MDKTINSKISDSAVKAKTGKVWQEWFAALDKAGAMKMKHSEIAGLLYDKFKVPGWWSQMVTVTYEQHRGLRAKHEKPNGYSVSASKTLTVPASTAFKFWKDEKLRNKWLSKTKIEIRKDTRPKSLRITWKDGKTSLEVNIYGKGPMKSQVVVQHNKLPNAKAAENMKAYWGKTLEKLSSIQNQD